MFLRQSTAGQEIPLGPFLDSVDGDSEEDGFTITNTDIKLWKAGTTTLVNKNSGGATNISDGIYYCVLDATDTNTLGSMKIYVHFAGSLYVLDNIDVVTANYYDTLFSTDLLDVNVTHIADLAQTGNDNGAYIDDILIDTGTTIPNLIELLNDPTIAQIAQGNWEALIALYDTVSGSF